MPAAFMETCCIEVEVHVRLFLSLLPCSPGPLELPNYHFGSNNLVHAGKPVKDSSKICMVDHMKMGLCSPNDTRQSVDLTDFSRHCRALVDALPTF